MGRSHSKSRYPKLQYIETNGRRRWRKQYKRKQYTWDARPDETKAESYHRVCRLWELKKAAIDSQEPSELLRRYSSEIVSALLPLAKSEKKVGLYSELEETLRLISVAKEIPVNEDGAVVGSNLEPPSERPVGNVQRARSKLLTFANQLNDALKLMGTEDPDPIWNREVQPLPPVEKTISALIEEYLERNRKANRRRLRTFEDWLPSQDPQSITSDRWAQFYEFLIDSVDSGKWSAAYARDILESNRRFLKWMANTKDIIELPRNFSDLSITTTPKEVKIYTIDEVKFRLENASERMKLYVLLTLNTAMTAIDIADLLPSEVNWKAGTITRKRSKTRFGKHGHNVPTVTYKLWPVTLSLLKQFHKESKKAAGNDLKTVLTTSKGNPIATRSMQGSGRNDSIACMLQRFNKVHRTNGNFLMFKKTSASLIYNHFQSMELSQLFLGHSPGKVAERSYVKVMNDRLDEALEWLAGEYRIW